MRTLLPLVCICAPLVAALAAAPDAPPVKPGERTTVQFKDSPPQSGVEQLKLRLRSADEPGPYTLEQEKFEILVPRGYNATTPHGIFVWISPGERPNLSAEWDKVLGQKKLIFIGAFNSGNNRVTFDRIRMAVDASHHVRQLYKIDPERVYISGHSGGARVASMVAVAYADMFTGAACFMGVNYFRNTMSKDGTVFEMRYFPHPEIAQIALQHNRFALVTGEKDFNRENTQIIYKDGFVEDGFKSVKLFDIPGQGHGAPSAQWLEKVIDFLDKGR
jgi:predicted esterase